MTSVPNPAMDRRALLRNSGLVLGFGAIVAACGSERGGLDSPGRLGVAPPPATLPSGEDTVVNDGVLLRTAQSLEYTALAVYEVAAGLDVLTADEATVVARFVEDHQRHAADIGALIDAAGAEQFECPNPFIMDRAVAPILDAIGGSDDVHRDVLNTAYAFEQLAAATYQAVVASFEDPSLRTAAMVIGGEENRHAAALAAAINPDELINPVLLGETAVDSDEDGFPTRYAIPATFGQLSGVPLTVGALDPEAGRFSISLQTPAANTFVYDFISC